MLIHNTAIKIVNASQEIVYIETNQDKNFGILQAPLKSLLSVSYIPVFKACTHR